MNVNCLFPDTRSAGGHPFSICRLSGLLHQVRFRQDGSAHELLITMIRSRQISEVSFFMFYFLKLFGLESQVLYLTCPCLLCLGPISVVAFKPGRVACSSGKTEIGRIPFHGSVVEIKLVYQVTANSCSSAYLFTGNRLLAALHTRQEIFVV